jgi:hypothetical protein
MRALRLVLPLALLAGCARAPSSEGPVPLAIAPAQTTALLPEPVEVSGQGFEARVQTDFTGREASTLEAAFQVRLLPSGGGAAVALGQVALTPRKTLTAVVPAGLARGTYDLEVIDPAGRSGVLARAFRVVTSAENVANFKVDLLEPARAGVAFLVSLSALDAQGQVVDGFTGTATVTDLTGTVSPGSAGPFVLGRLQTRLTVTPVTAADTVTVTDALGRSGTSVPFAVTPGPPVALAFAGAPVSAAAGACSPPIALELRDAQGNAAPAAAAVAVELQSAPAGSLAFFADASCAAAASTVTIAAGSAQATFRFVGAAAGPVAVRAVPAGLPSVEQGETVTP